MFIGLLVSQIKGTRQSPVVWLIHMKETGSTLLIWNYKFKATHFFNTFSCVVWLYGIPPTMPSALQVEKLFNRKIKNFNNTVNNVHFYLSLFIIAMSLSPTVLTPTRPNSHSTKVFVSDHHPSPTGSKQDVMKNAVGLELDGYTPGSSTRRAWQKCCLQNRCKFPFKSDQVGTLDAYIDNTIPHNVRQDAITFFGMPPTFPKSNTELDHYEPLCRLLNKCVEACHKALGDSKGEYYRDLNLRRMG